MTNKNSRLKCFKIIFELETILQDRGHDQLYNGPGGEKAVST